MFSIVIPLYNKELSIRHTIQSILDQSVRDFEVIIVNDGSTDNSPQIVEEMNDERIRLIHQDNQGVSAARNRGIKEAIHDWIAFLDGDDLWEKTHLAEFKKTIKDFPDTNWLCSGFTIMNGKKSRDKVFDINGKVLNVFDSLLLGMVIHTSTVCVKRRLFERYNDLFFRYGLSSSEDREVWYKLACIDNSPAYIAKSLSIYNISDDDSLTRKNAKRMPNDFLNMKERIVDFSEMISKEDQQKLFKFIADFNRKALLERYKRGFFEDKYVDHLSASDFFIMRSTVAFPRQVRFIISRVLSKL